ncbi:MAG: flavodoxin family protein [Dethiosulfovibrio peptidovorans]|nr:MAG: flavodoxin family protein [Dethiosulfovibrio peptidovorans]
MNTIGLAYWSSTGNTETMAEAFKDAVEAKGGNIYFSSAENMDKEAFMSADVWVFGSPACGTEEINDTDIEPLIDDLGDKLKGRKVFMFGSFGWGDGEYMETWTADMEAKGAIIAADPVTCLETPDDEALGKIKAAVEVLLG